MTRPRILSLLALAIALCVAPNAAWALFDVASPGVIKSGPFMPAGAGQYAVSLNSVQTLTVPSEAYIAEICVETAAARYTDDGSTPSGSTGMPVAAGTCFAYSGPLVAFKIFGSGATMDVSYYK